MTNADRRKRIEEIREIWTSTTELDQDIQFLIFQIDKQDEALRFYSDKKHWSYEQRFPRSTRRQVDYDRGKIAREALGEE